MATVLGVARAIAADRTGGWTYIVNNRVVCRSLDGVCLRGLFVDRTSQPGRYKIWAFTQTWASFDVHPNLELSIEVGFVYAGQPSPLAEQVAVLLDADEEARGVAFAGPADPVLISARTRARELRPPMDPTRLQMLLIRAWEGRCEGIGAELEELRGRMAEGRVGWASVDRDRAVIADLATCVREGRDVREAIAGWSTVGRAGVKVREVGRMRLGVPGVTGAGV